MCTQVDVLFAPNPTSYLKLISMLCHLFGQHIEICWYIEYRVNARKKKNNRVQLNVWDFFYHWFSEMILSIVTHSNDSTLKVENHHKTTIVYLENSTDQKQSFTRLIALTLIGILRVNSICSMMIKEKIGYLDERSSWIFLTRKSSTREMFFFDQTCQS